MWTQLLVVLFLNVPMMLCGRMSLQLWCLSFRQPYAGLVLDGVKTVESRWRPVLGPLENQTMAVHVAWRDWEGQDWRSVLSGPLGMSRAQIQDLLDSGERFGRGVVAGEAQIEVWSLQGVPECITVSPAGLVDVGETWLCPASSQEEGLHHLERSAVLIGLQDKYLTHLSNPRWLKEPLEAPGGCDLWSVDIPVHLLP